MENITQVRDQFPITKNKVFLNHAAMSPPPKPVADAVRKCLDDFSNFGTTSMEWNDGGKPFFAKLVGAKPQEIALVENTSMGMNMAANAIRPQSGSKVVTTDLEYPSVVYPWLRESLGVKVHYVKNVDGKILLEDFEKAVDDNTAAVSVSHVEYANGFRNDLKALSEIAHEHGAYLVVDAIQSAGAMQIDVKKDDVDFLATAGYKWLLSPVGAGYLYVRDELIQKLEPPFAGWASVKQEIFNTVDFWEIWKLQLSETASRFEVGSPSYLSLMGATEALKLLLNAGIANVEQRILKLTDYLMEGLMNLGVNVKTPREKQCRSGIVLAEVDKPKELCEALTQKGIVTSARSRGLRISPHFYNTEQEIDKLLTEIKEWLKKTT